MAIAVHPGAGLDATANIQTAIDTGDAVVSIPYSSGNDWIVSSPPTFTDSNQETDPAAVILRRDNQIVRLEAGVVVRAKADSFHGKYQKAFSAIAQSTVGMWFGAGSSIFMRKEDYTGGGTYTTAEWRHCLQFSGCNGVTVTGAGMAENHLNNSGGDGLYIGPIVTSGPGRLPCTNVVVSDMKVGDNARNGLTILSVNGFTGRRLDLSDSSGRPPQGGAVLEPEANIEDELTGVLFEDCRGQGNASYGVVVAIQKMTASHKPIDVTLRRFHSERGVLTTNWGLVSKFNPGAYATTPTGSIVFEDCIVRLLDYPGIHVGWDVQCAVITHFRNVILDATAALGGAELPIDLVFQGTGDHATGGIHLDNVTVLESADRAVIKQTGIASTTRCVWGNVNIIKRGGRMTTVQSLSQLPDLHTQVIQAGLRGRHKILGHYG